TEENKNYKNFLIPSLHIILFLFVTDIFSQPVANFSSDIHIACAPQIIHFFDQSEGAPTSWFWDFGNNNTSTLQNPDVIYGEPGAYTVILVVSNNSGSDTLIKPYYITAFSPPVCGFEISDSSACIHDIINFFDASIPQSCSIAHWFWDFGDGSNSNLQNAQYAYQTPGIYTVSLLVTDINGCNSFYHIDNIITVNEIQADFSYSVTSCNFPINISFENLSSGIGLTCLWYFGDGNSSTLSNPQHSYNIPGAYYVSLNITDEMGCSDSTAQDISMSNYNTDFSFTTDCEDNDSISFQFNDLSVPTPVTWFWSFSDGGTDTVQNPVHIYTDSLEVVISLTVVYELGCSDTFVKAYQPLIASYQAETLYCSSPFQVAFNNQTQGSEPLSYEWNFGDGQSDTIENPIHSYSLPASVIFRKFSINYYVSDNYGCKDTLLDSIFFSRPYTDFEANIASGCIPLDIEFTDKSISPDTIVEWFWNFGDGVTSTEQNPVHTYTDTGVFSVTLKVFTEMGCEDTSTFDGYIKAGIKPDFVDFILSYENLGCYENYFTMDTLCFMHEYLIIDSSGYSDTSIYPNCWKWAMNPNTFHSFDYFVFSQAETDTLNSKIMSIGWNELVHLAGYNECYDTIIRWIYVAPPADLIFLSEGYWAACSPPLSVGIFQHCYTCTSILNFYMTDLQTGVMTDLDPDDITYMTFDHSGRYSMYISAINDTIKHGGCGFCNSAYLITIDSASAGFNIMPDTACDRWNTYHFSDTTFSRFGNIYQVAWSFGDGDTLMNDSVRYIIYYDTVKQFMSLTDTVFPAQIEGTDTTMNPVRNVDGNHDGHTVGTYKYPVHTYRDTGTYIVKCSVLIHVFFRPGKICGDFLDCWYFIYDTIRVDYPIYPDFEVDLSGCDSIIAAFRDISIARDSIVYREWDFGDGSPVDTTENPVHIYHNTENYSVTLILEDSRGCRDTIVKQDIIQTHNPSAVFAVTPQPACFGEQVTMICNAQDSTWIYNWSFGNGTTDTSISPLYTYPAPGNYTASLTVTDTNNCSDSASFFLHIAENPLASFTADTITGICPPVPVIFCDSSSGSIISWQWDFGDGMTAVFQNPSHIYTETGIYNIIQIVVDTNGCSDTLIMPSYIAIIGPSGNYTATPDSGCLPHPVHFIANANYTDYYFWDFGDGSITHISAQEQGDNVTHTYLSPGVFTPALILENANKCLYIVPPSISIYVFKWPTALFSYNSIIQDQTVEFINQSENSDSWLWYFGNGDSSRLMNPVYSYPEPGDYFIIMIANNKAGCTDTVFTKIYVPSETTGTRNVFLLYSSQSS
ncbi:MAG: PKD domain-containing protein, partial [Bacteroidia bacterium]|nr:PKD domain-containing protein [Bacteroidia bacterium]